MNGSLTLLDDNLLYIAFSIIGISSKNDQKMKFRGRGGGPMAQSLICPNMGCFNQNTAAQFEQFAEDRICTICKRQDLHYCRIKYRVACRPAENSEVVFLNSFKSPLGSKFTPKHLIL